MTDFEHYNKVGVLAGSRAFGGKIGRHTDWDLFVLAEDVQRVTGRIDGSVYTDLIDGVSAVFYIDTPDGMLNIQVVESKLTFERIKLAIHCMKVVSPVPDKVQRIERWRLALALAGVQNYKPYAKPSFLTKLINLFT